MFILFLQKDLIKIYHLDNNFFTVQKYKLLVLFDIRTSLT